MSMYGRNTNNRFSGYYSDLPELIGQKPEGIDGEWVIITSLNKKYYWDISTRAWTDGGSIDATLANQGNINACGNTVVSTYLDKFRDDFDIFDTTNNWTVVQQGANHTISVEGVANGSRYLKINSSTGANQETIILSKAHFTLPFEVSVGLSLSARASNGTLQAFFEIVEIDPATGEVIEDSSIVAAPLCNNARNCASWLWDGTSATATQAKYNLRTSGLSELTSANVTSSTTTATGTTPNFIQASNYTITALNDLVNWQAQAIDSLVLGGSFKRTQRSIDPTKKYSVRIRLKSVGTPANTDFRIHTIRVMDASRVSVDFGLMDGIGLDNQRAIPVQVTSNPTTLVVENPSTSYGNALYHTLISDASINATNIKSTTCLLTSLNAFNRADYSCFLKTYSKATVPDPATDTPTAIYTLRPGNNDLINLGRYAHRHVLGLSYIITKNPDPTDTTPIAAGDVILNISYA